MVVAPPTVNFGTMPKVRLPGVFSSKSNPPPLGAVAAVEVDGLERSVEEALITPSSEPPNVPNVSGVKFRSLCGVGRRLRHVGVPLFPACDDFRGARARRSTCAPSRSRPFGRAWTREKRYMTGNNNILMHNKTDAAPAATLGLLISIEPVWGCGSRSCGYAAGFRGGSHGCAGEPGKASRRLGMRLRPVRQLYVLRGLVTARGGGRSCDTMEVPGLKYSSAYPAPDGERDGCRRAHP